MTLCLLGKNAVPYETLILMLLLLQQIQGL